MAEFYTSAADHALIASNVATLALLAARWDGLTSVVRQYIAALSHPAIRKEPRSAKRVPIAVGVYRLDQYVLS